jgi:hypothetical protein
MSGSIKMSGLTELQKFISEADEDIRTEATTIVHEATEQTAREWRRRMPRGETGNLQAGLTTKYPAANEIVGVTLSSAPHSHLVEFGTKNRKTKSGADRGKMPKLEGDNAGFIAQRNRSQMYNRLLQMIKRFGFEISGT